MRSILLIHKPHYRQRRSVHERRTGIAVDVSCEERSSTFLVGENTWPASWFGRKDTRLANWRWHQYSHSLCDALPASLQSTKPHYRQQGRVCKAGTVVTVDVSSEERTSDLPGRWKHVTCFVIGRKDTRLADWIWRQRSRSFELAGRLMLLKQRSLGQCTL